MGERAVESRAAAGHAGVGEQVLDGYRLLRAVQVNGCKALYEAVAPDSTQLAIRAVCLDAPRARHRPLDNEYASLRRLAGFCAVPAVVGVGRTDTERYMATTWAPGSHLDRNLRKTLDLAPAPPLPAIAETFAALHARGVVHADVNRHNILLTSDQEVRIIDFENSRRLEDDTPLALRHSGITICFAAPEARAALHDQDKAPAVPTPAWDQYALAALFYYQLTGHAHRMHPDKPTSDRSTAFPLHGPAAARWPGLPAVLATALAHDPADRHPSTAAFAHALHRAMGG
ncbi:protein kinase [Streptomyces sp. NPDC051555]|uniref:protein kinase domain-containing protein n=1 Tax=Streptomyces sp. NPDC051555 TaxID=3365657 RepID=UPI0037922DB6